MKVILQADVKNIGKKGEIVEVADGYGRNFLLPKKLALPASATNVNVAKAQAGSKARKDAMAEDEARLMAAQLEKVTAVIPVRIGENGRLFGAVTGKDVAEALKKQNRRRPPQDRDPRRGDRRGHLRGGREGAPEHRHDDSDSRS